MNKMGEEVKAARGLILYAFKIIAFALQMEHTH